MILKTWFFPQLENERWCPSSHFQLIDIPFESLKYNQFKIDRSFWFKRLLSNLTLLSPIRPIQKLTNSSSSVFFSFMRLTAKAFSKLSQSVVIPAYKDFFETKFSQVFWTFFAYSRSKYLTYKPLQSQSYENHS